MKLSSIIEMIVVKGGKDNLISQRQKKILDNVDIDLLHLEDALLKINDKEISKILMNLFDNMTSQVINTTRARFINKLNGSAIIWFLLFSDFLKTNNKSEFMYKINVTLNTGADTEKMLECLDYIYCVRMGNEIVKSGLCLGTKHYVIDGNDVSLLIFALEDDNPPEWVVKGSKSVLNYTNPTKFNKNLKSTAQRLIATHFSKD